jgi:hypothetical protein
MRATATASTTGAAPDPEFTLRFIDRFFPSKQWQISATAS